MNLKALKTQPSVPRTACIASIPIPPMNRWATIIRRLRRLLRQISVP